MSGRVTAYIGLGANVGDARTTLANAVRALAALPGADVRSVSPLYVTRPVGTASQPDFHNAVVALDVPPGPDPETGALALLAALKQLEAAFGRRPRERWGPREVDLDLLLFGDHVISARRDDGRWLEIPHPEMTNRLFVLAPLAELAADLRPPGWEETVAEAARRRLREEGAAAANRVAAWRAETTGWD